MKLKITSDGTVPGTHITDEEGNRITNIQALEIRWKLDAYGKSGDAFATIECRLTPCDITVVGQTFEEDLNWLKANAEPKEGEL